jgi:hypothetical protein
MIMKKKKKAAKKKAVTKKSNGTQAVSLVKIWELTIYNFQD